MKIAFFDTKPFEKEYLEKKLEAFEKHFFAQKVNDKFEPNEDIKDAEIISAFIDSEITGNVMKKFPNLKYIVLRSVGYSHVDLVCAKERGIKVFNAPHYGDSSIAEYVFALLLSNSRKIITAAFDVKNQKVEDAKYQGIELHSKTLGIVGLGAIGKKVFEIAKAFSMEVLCYDINKEEGYSYVSLDELCQKSDIISINCPLTSNTIHMFDSNRFQKTKDGVIIINTARGEVIDTLALFEALLSKKVSFAALDVIECEDILYEDKENPIDINSLHEKCLKNYYVSRKLLEMDNVLITPHIAYNTFEAKYRILEITVENIISLTKFTNSAKNLVLI